MKVTKGLLSFVSGLGFMGLCFYILFFTIIEIESKFLSNYILLFSILTSILACIVVYFLAIAFSFTDTKLELNSKSGGFIGGILSMIAIIIMILSFRLEALELMQDVELVDAFHPIITFFLAAASMMLFVWPEEKVEEGKW
jgi:hypothetical protein